MSKEIMNEGKKLFQCPFCKRAYMKKELADLCESWCMKHDKPNEEITKHSEPIKEV